MTWILQLCYGHAWVIKDWTSDYDSRISGLPCLFLLIFISFTRPINQELFIFDPHFFLKLQSQNLWCRNYLQTVELLPTDFSVTVTWVFQRGTWIKLMRSELPRSPEERHIPWPNSSLLTCSDSCRHRIFRKIGHIKLLKPVQKKSSWLP